MSPLQVVDDRGFKCPFLNGRKVSLPSGSVVMADYFSSAMDPKFWHEPYTFDITRKKEGEALIAASPPLTPLVLDSLLLSRPPSPARPPTCYSAT